MIVNKSMYPIQTGFSVISQMQDKMATLQMQLGTGAKSPTLAGMGRDLPLSLSVRQRLDRIEGFSANIETVGLRLSFLDKTLSRFDKIEGEARNSAVQGQYGTGNINMATLPDLSKARFDEIVTMLNSEVAGRYLFGGATTDSAPLPNTNELLEGAGGRAGFKTVVSERKAADLGANGYGRVNTGITGSTVTLGEDGVHPFGLKLSNISTTAANTSVTYTSPAATNPPTAKNLSVTFAPAPAEQIRAGESVTMGFTLPDGTETQITLRATTDTPPGAGEFTIGADADATAANFKGALETRLTQVGGSELAGASVYEASENFFNGAGEPVLRVSGNPATSLRVATEADTVMWYRGQSPAIAAEGLGRLGISSNANAVTLQQTAPVSAKHGFQLTDVSGSTANITTSLTGTDPSSIGVTFANVPVPGETVTMTLTQPDGTNRTVSLTAVTGTPGPGQFRIGGDVNSTAANFSTALNASVTTAAKAAEGNPRQSVTAQIDDSTSTAYGMQANEDGFLRMIRSLGAMSVETYPDSDPNSKGRFDAMATRQHSQLSEAHNSERGSIEILTMELGIAQGSLENTAKRHTDYKAQLDNLLSDVETISKEDVSMEILALQTRMQASYQVTAMVSKLSLANYM